MLVGDADDAVFGEVNRDGLTYEGDVFLYERMGFRDRVVLGV